MDLKQQLLRRPLRMSHKGKQGRESTLGTATRPHSILKGSAASLADKVYCQKLGSINLEKGRMKEMMKSKKWKRNKMIV